MELITIEGTIEKIYENIDEYKKGLTPKAKEKGFGYLLDTKDGKIIIIADKDLLRLGLVRVGNYVKAIGWFKDKGIFLATMTVGNVDEEKFGQIKPNLRPLF